VRYRSAFSSHEELKMSRYIILASVTNGEGSRHYTWLQIGMGRGEDAANAEIKLDFTTAKRNRLRANIRAKVI
jgi:hypothetical protein